MMQRRGGGWGKGGGEDPCAKDGLPSPLELNEIGSRHGLGVKTEIVLPFSAKQRAGKQGVWKLPALKH